MNPQAQYRSLSPRARLALLFCTVSALILILCAGAALASSPTSPPLGKADPNSAPPSQQPEYTCTSISFASAVNYTSGSLTSTVISADFNKDGKLDYAAANTSSSNVSVRLGNGDGTFGASTTFPVGPLPRDVIAADFNKDGNLDLATANVQNSNVAILLGTGTGSFGSATYFSMDTGTYAVAAGDFNGDGNLDIVTANFSNSTVSIRLGTGTGSFGSVANFGLNGATNPNTILAGDFDRDGFVDVLTANQSTNNLSFLRGNGNGTFATALNTGLGGGTSPYSVVVGDFNGDGLFDVATANNGTNNVTVYLTDGPLTIYGLNGGTAPTSIKVGDFNGDGNQDLVVSDANTNNISTLKGTGTGNFNAAVNFGLNGATTPNSVVVGDFNRDGREDLATANQGTGNVSILLSNCTAVCQTGYFDPPINFATGSGPRTVAVGDFNRDGELDLAVSNILSNSVSVLIGSGGSFDPPLNNPVGTNAQSVTVGDFNGDGNQDLVTANFDSSNISILIGSGNGSFGAHTDFTVGTGPKISGGWRLQSRW